jgi:plasmid maintenance system antidote protein VapI
MKKNDRLRKIQYLIGLLGSGEKLTVKQIARFLKITDSAVPKIITDARKLLKQTSLCLSYDVKSKKYQMLVMGNNFTAHIENKIDQQTGNKVVMLKVQRANFSSITESKTIIINEPQKDNFVNTINDDVAVLADRMNKLAEEGIPRETLLELPQEIQDTSYPVRYHDPKLSLFDDNKIKKQLKRDACMLSLELDAINRRLKIPPKL